jgi:hypothetical protein
MQKTQSNGQGDTRYFWQVSSVVEGEKTSGEYRSRCVTAAGVKAQFVKNGHTNVRVSAATA